MVGEIGQYNSIYQGSSAYGTSASGGSSDTASSALGTASASGSGSNVSADGKPVVNPGESTKKLPGHKSSPAECQTCKNRKYQDGSDESNVSFKSAQHIDPNNAFAEVSAHEGEHVANAYNKARQNNGKVVTANVSIHTSICPECGRTYVSGGTTSTQIKYYNESNPYQQSLKSSDAANKYLGRNVNAAV